MGECTHDQKLVKTSRAACSQCLKTGAAKAASLPTNCIEVVRCYDNVPRAQREQLKRAVDDIAKAANALLVAEKNVAHDETWQR